jgi:hypothetical protein
MTITMTPTITSAAATSQTSNVTRLFLSLEFMTLFVSCMAVTSFTAGSLERAMTLRVHFFRERDDAGEVMVRLGIE